MKTPITYYGGKQAIIHKILPLIPQHECYTEVFFGGGTVFFAKDPVKNETINDKLDIVINFYKVLRNNYRQLSKKIDQALISRTIHREQLAILRTHKNHNKIDVAFAFWYCCNFSFMNKIGGGIKYSNDQSVSVTRILKNKKKDFTQLLQERIENTNIENDDACKILRSRNVSKAYHYIDPPYVGSDQGQYRGYKENDLIDLVQTCSTLKGKFTISSYTHPVLIEAIEKYNWNYIDISMRLKSPRKNKLIKTELLISNYYTEANSQISLFTY